MLQAAQTLGILALTILSVDAVVAQEVAPASTVVPQHDVTPSRSHDQETAERLAIELSRYASDMLATPPVSVEAIRSSTIFLREATDLAPWDVQIAYRAMEVAVLSEDVEDIQSAVAHLLRVVPDDQVAQLRQLVMAIDQFQYAQERVRAYGILLQQDNRDVLGPVLSARLAFQLAMLHRRMGDQDAFGRWIGESMSLDPSYAEAMAVGAGYFQTRVNDPVASVELLVSLLLADLADSSTPTVLANILMEHGAYDSAQRMYMLAISDLLASLKPPSNNLLADHALAEWGSGHGDVALASIQQRQLELDELYRTMAVAEQPEMSPLDLARLEAPISPTLATVRAVIASDSDVDTAVDALSAAKESYLSAIRILQQNPEDTNHERASAMLELAWLQLWLGSDVEDAEARVSAAAQLEDLGEDARARFDGWILFRQGFLKDATTAFEPLVENDTAAKLGLAMVQQEQGLAQDAARNYLSLAREATGTLIGIWSQHRLEDLLGTALPPTETIIAMSTLVDSIPKVVDRYPSDPRLAVSFRIDRAQADVQPYEPVAVVIEFSNNTPMPMAISPEGPLRELLLLRPDVQIAGKPPIRFGPLVYDIGQRLRLEPFEKFSLHFDLRSTWVGRALNMFPLDGASVLLTGISNFNVSNENKMKRAVFSPGLLGLEITGAPIRVDGVRVSDDWAASIIVDSKSATLTSKHLSDLALLAAVISHDGRNANNALLSPETLKQSIDGILEVFQRLDSVQQAWFLSVQKQSSGLEPLRALALESNSRLVSMILLVRLLEQEDNLQILDDPMLISSLRSSDPSVKSLAEWVERRVQQLLDQEVMRENAGSSTPASP